MYGIWPVEAVAVRRGVKLSSNGKSMDPTVKEQLQKLLDQQVAHVDRVERIPSPYMWQTLQDLQKRVSILLQQVSTLNLELDANASDQVMDVASIVHSQTEAITRVAHDVARVHDQMDLLRTKYNQTERGENVLIKAEMAEYERQVRLEQQSKQQFMKAAGSVPQQAATAPAPSGGLFGSIPAAAPSSGLFGSTPAPTPAPSGGLFGSTSAPTAPSGGLFGSSTPAPAPTGGLFGSTPAPAPSGGGLFGSTPAPTPTGGLFGSTPAAAPSTTETTPAAPPSAASGFSFAGATTPAAPVTATTPRAKGSGRSRNRSRR
jgi:hypothetical protein